MNFTACRQQCVKARNGERDYDVGSQRQIMMRDVGMRGQIMMRDVGNFRQVMMQDVGNIWADCDAGCGRIWADRDAGCGFGGLHEGGALGKRLVWS